MCDYMNLDGFVTNEGQGIGSLSHWGSNIQWGLWYQWD